MARVSMRKKARDKFSGGKIKRGKLSKRAATRAVKAVMKQVKKPPTKAQLAKATKKFLGKVTLVVPNKVPRYSDSQVQVFRQVERTLKKKLNYSKMDFVKRYHTIIPTTDEILQMGIFPAAAFMARTIKIGNLSAAQKAVLNDTRRRLIFDMNFELDLTGMPSGERISFIGHDAAVEELYRSSIRWTGICR